MKRGLVGFAIFLTVAAAVFLSWTTSIVHDRTVRSRLTLTVETPEGLRTGSSVTELTTTFGPFQLKRGSTPGWSIGTFLTGEGVVVDLGPRGLLVALLVKRSWLSKWGFGGTTGYAGVWPFPESQYSGSPPPGSSSAEKYMIYLDELKRVKPKADISFEDVPVLVRFSDPNDPASISLVDPSSLADAFGPGVRLNSATVEITSDPITHSIGARLPWLKQGKTSECEIKRMIGLFYHFRRRGMNGSILPPNFRCSAFSKAE